MNLEHFLKLDLGKNRKKKGYKAFSGFNNHPFFYELMMLAFSLFGGLISWRASWCLEPVQVAPLGQEFFKQSNTRLHFIATRAMDMTGELFNDPWESLRWTNSLKIWRSFYSSATCLMKKTGVLLKLFKREKRGRRRKAAQFLMHGTVRMTELISALGLRHVGYGIPTDLIQPFANCFIEVLRENAPGEDSAIEGFEWSICLVAKILIRVIQEGSTIVMKVLEFHNASFKKHWKPSWI